MLHQQQDQTTIAKLVDFGCAEKFGQGAATAEAVEYRRAGTRGYMAPEIMAMEPYGAPSDIWSLGVLLYAMLTATLPYPKIGKNDGKYKMA